MKENSNSESNSTHLIFIRKKFNGFVYIDLIFYNKYSGIIHLSKTNFDITFMKNKQMTLFLSFRIEFKLTLTFP